MQTTPRISLNKLAEYLHSTAARRRAIVKQAKEPPPAIVPLYRNAISPLERFFSTGNIIHVESAIERLRRKPATSDWQRDDNLNTAAALEEFLEVAEHFSAGGYTVTRANPQERSKLLVAGVEVSIRPDFDIRFERRGQEFTGAVKFHWIKDDSHKLDDQGGKAVATAVHQFLMHRGSQTSRPSLEHCMSVDVFRHQVYTAPRSNTRIWQNIEAACEEIAMRWNRN